VAGGRVFILSDRDIQFQSLEPTEPEFQLAGDSERVAITCAALGVRADELELPVPLDRIAYRRAKQLLEARGIVEKGKLTRYGRAVEAMPTERPWAELLVNADDAMIPFLAVMCSVESLHRMTREERELDGLIVPGSDHLTAYNLYAEAFSAAGSMGEVYGLPRHVFDEEALDEWANRRGALVKSIEDAALGMASIYRGVGLPLPQEMSNAGEKVLRKFQELLARYMPFTLVIDEETASGDEARVSKTSVCGSWGAIAGELRYFADKFGNPRASIEGTQVPADFIRKYALTGEAELIYDPERKQAALSLRRKVTYYGFELEREVEVIDQFPPELAAQARHVLAEAMARGEARHPGVHRNRIGVEEVREVYRRSAGQTPKLGLAELTAIYERQLAGVNSLTDFRHARVDFDPDAVIPAAERQRYADLPDSVEIRGKDVEIQYDVEESESGTIGVARLRLPEKVARNMSEAELPTLDRPLRFVVTRGMRGAARATTLDELQEELDRPFTREEIEGFERAKNRSRDERRERKKGERRGENGGSNDRFVRDDRKVPSDRNDGRRRKPNLRAKRGRKRR
jgi:hypothetical protein